MNFIKNLVYDENGIPSLTDVIALTGFSIFVIASAYLIINGKNWANYDKFAELTGGGGAALKLGKVAVNEIAGALKRKE